MIIQLTDKFSGIIFVNTDHIVFINPHDSHTVVKLIENQSFDVEESASDIMNMINSCSK